MPTATASCRARSSCTLARASGPVTHFEAPVRVAMRPSSESAELERHVRQARGDELGPRRDERARLGRAAPDLDPTPAVAQPLGAAARSRAGSDRGSR